jgi:tetratricopeptide (TPR) repeat protein
MMIYYTMVRRIFIFLAFSFITMMLNGQSIFEILLRSKALIEAGNSKEAVDLLTSVLNEKEESRLYIERAEAYMGRGDYQNAITDLNSANKAALNSGDYGLSRIYALKGDAGTSLYHLERNLRSPFKKAEKEVLLDPAFVTIENSTEWRQFWKTEWYSKLETGISEFEYYLNEGMKEDALTSISELDRDYKDNFEVIYARALLYLSSGKSPEALKILSGLLESQPENEKYLRLMAKVQMAMSNYAGASVTYSKLLSIEIPDAKLYLLRAECYQKTGETKKAAADAEKFLSLYPQSKQGLRITGKIYSASGNYLEALEYFSENLKYHPDDPECFIDRADTYLLSRSWDWAMRDYSMSLDLDPSNAEAWLNKGVALLNSGKKDDACHDFRKSFSLGNKKATSYISKNCIE